MDLETSCLQSKQTNVSPQTLKLITELPLCRQDPGVSECEKNRAQMSHLGILTCVFSRVTVCSFLEFLAHVMRTHTHTQSNAYIIREGKYCLSYWSKKDAADSKPSHYICPTLSPEGNQERNQTPWWLRLKKHK